MQKIEIRDYTKISPKGRAAGRRCTFYAVAAGTVEEAKAKALRTHARRIATGALAPAAKSLGAGDANHHPAKIDYLIF